ncbi:MAG: hypothetical protein ACO3YU_06385 [Candidatus Nanopelagicales bacterium]
MNGADPARQVREAAIWAFSTFRRNLLAFIALAAIVTAVQFLQQLSVQPLTNVVNECSDPQTPGQEAACANALATQVLTSGTLTLVFSVLILVVTVGVIRASIRATLGQEPGFDALLDGHNLGRFLLYQLAYALLTGLGFLLFVLPGLLVIFFFQLGPYYILDRGMRVGQAFAASAQVIRRNLPAAFMMTALNAFVLVLGSVFFGLLTLLTLPIASLFTAYLYRQFNDETVIGG